MNSQNWCGRPCVKLHAIGTCSAQSKPPPVSSGYLAKRRGTYIPPRGSPRWRQLANVSEPVRVYLAPNKQNEGLVRPPMRETPRYRRMQRTVLASVSRSKQIFTSVSRSKQTNICECISLQQMRVYLAPGASSYCVANNIDALRTIHAT